MVVVAEEQTAGRGRGANRWWTGRGSLAFSLVFDPAGWSLEDELQPARSLAVGVAIVDTIAPLLPGSRVGLHWPNVVRRAADINIMLALFNMVPVPPLDGGNVLAGLLPGPAAAALDRLRPFGFIILYALLLTGALSALILPPADFLMELLGL